MNNLPLKALVWDWSYGDGGKTNAVCRAKSPSHEYIIRLEAGGDCYVDYRRFDNDEDADNRKDEPPVFGSIKAAQEWVEAKHYPHKMQPYVKPDSITDIANWFKAAKPEPTDKDKTTQLGCVVEEFAELMESVGLDGTARELQGIADELKGFTEKYATKFVSRINKIDSLDATSDITVTVQGFNQLMGFDGLGAQREVIRSNNSKMVKGEFEFDANGKIMKPDSYSKPDLTPFVKQGE